MTNKRTLMTKAEQTQFLSDNWEVTTITHKWSSRGYGSSRIVDKQDNVLGKANGCGYDRYGTALGNAIEAMFPEQLLRLAKSKCKGRNPRRKGSNDFYGLFLVKAEDGTRAYTDGGCGSDCMMRILNKIGFSLKFVAGSNKSSGGEGFYSLVPITKTDRKWLK